MEKKGCNWKKVLDTAGKVLDCCVVFKPENKKN